MALSKDKVLSAVKDILTGPRAQEAPRLERIRLALRPHVLPGEFTPTVQIPTDAPPLMRELARKSATNYLPLLVKTFGQVLKVDGYFTTSDEGGTDPWVWWQRNRMDSRQTGIGRGALQYGVSYATALPGTFGRGQAGPAISLFSPREMTALYADPESDEWPLLALAVDGNHFTLYDEEQEYRVGLETRRPTIMPASGSLPYDGGDLTYIGESAHETGVCPVVRYRDRNLLSGEEQLGIVEPLMTVQERIDETEFHGLVNRYFQAFKQRYVLGWVPKDEREELKAGAARIWYLDEDPADVKIDQLESGDSKSDIEASAAAKRDFAALGQLPAQALGVDGISNISEATLAGLEAAKNRESEEIATSFGESHEQLLRLCAYIDGNQTAADDYASEVRWRDFEARSFAQTVDGLVKLAQGLGLPPEIALEDVPGMTEQKLARARTAMRRAASRQTLADLSSTGAGDIVP